MWRLSHEFLRLGDTRSFFSRWCHVACSIPPTWNAFLCLHSVFFSTNKSEIDLRQIQRVLWVFPSLFVPWNKKRNHGTRTFFLCWWDGACCIAQTRKKTSLLSFTCQTFVDNVVSFRNLSRLNEVTLRELILANSANLDKNSPKLVPAKIKYFGHSPK